MGSPTHPQHHVPAGPTPMPTPVVWLLWPRGQPLPCSWKRWYLAEAQFARRKPQWPLKDANLMSGGQPEAPSRGTNQKARISDA